jgi:flagellar biogenesis protein FliO
MGSFFRIIIAAICALGAACAATPAFAMTTLKQVQVSGASQIDLLFDGKVSKGQIRTEFFNDVIQLSLSDSAIYPAKISSINGGKLVKIFAYQYAPKLVRCRLTVKGRAEDYKDRLSLAVNGKLLTVKILEVATKSEDGAAPAGDIQAAASRAEDASSTSLSPKAQEAKEAALLEHVKSGAPVKASASAVATASAAVADASVPLVKNSEKAHVSRALNEEEAVAAAPPTKPMMGANHPLGGGRSMPSPWGVLGKLLLVVGLFCGVAMAFKRFVKSSSVGNRAIAARFAAAPEVPWQATPSVPNRSTAKTQGDKGFFGILSGFARSAGANLTRKGKMVEVLSSHYLGPKKSISIVRIADRILVLGISNESINLITELDESEVGDLNLESLGVGATLNAITAPSRSQAAARSAAAEYVKSGLPPAATAPMAARTASRQGFPGDETLGEPNMGTGRGGVKASPFADLLQAEANRTYSQSKANPAAQPAGAVRSQIRSRLEGLKQL